MLEAMEKLAPFTSAGRLDPDGLIANILRKGTPKRVFHMELFQDYEIEQEIDRRYGVTTGLDRNSPDFGLRRGIAMQRFLGYEGVPCGLLSLDTGKGFEAPDTADKERSRGNRHWIDEATGPITSWDEFEKYPWPDGKTWDTSDLEWYEHNLPDDMTIVGRQGHFCEYLCWLMGYETLCVALFESRDLVTALAKRILDLEEAATKVLLQSKRVRFMFASDDMGFKTGLLISPNDMREFVLQGHKRLAQLCHDAGRPYILHACGKRADIIEDLIEDVKLDALHSWEDVIEPIAQAKRAYGGRLSLIGGIDLDFLCRATPDLVRRRVRETIAVCQPGGGFCLGSGNSVANYVPVDNYIAMLDEGRKL
jgi:uroporphyrinogen decarboxylase